MARTTAAGRRALPGGRGRSLVLAALLLAPLPALAENCIPADIASVQDGNTLRARIKGREQPVRLLGYETPELGFRARCEAEDLLAVEARHRLMELVRDAGEAQLCPSKRLDQYGRVLATLLLDGQDVAVPLIAEGLARPDDGGKQPGWCD